MSDIAGYTAARMANPFTETEILQKDQTSLYQHTAEQVDKTVHRLSDAVQLLTARLQPVLDPNVPPADGAADRDSPARLASAPVIDHLDRVGTYVHNAAAELEAVISRLVI